MENGYILLHRKILNWQWYHDTNVFSLFIDLLLDANYEDSKIGFQVIKRGQVLTSLKRMSERTGLSYKEIRTALSKLEKSGEIDKQTTNRYSIITIKNYNDYQDIDKQRANKRQTKGNIKEYKEEKEYKEDNILSKDNNIYVDLENEFEEVWKLYPRKEGKAKAKNIFIKARKKGITKELILEGLNNYLSYIRFKSIEPQYIKMGSTWFNGECWNDTYNLETKIKNKSNNVFAELLEEEENGKNNSFINAEYIEKSIS